MQTAGDLLAIMSSPFTTGNHRSASSAVPSGRDLLSEPTEVFDASSAEPKSTRENRRRTACFNCRALRQRCDRRIPCSRCTAQSRKCRYPLRTNRGKKTNHNSQSKIELINGLLSRLGEDAIRQRVISSLLNTDLAEFDQHTLSPPVTSLEAYEEQSTITHLERKHDQHHCASDYGVHSIVSPLDTMAAVVADGSKSCLKPIDVQATISPFHQLGRNASVSLVDSRLAAYFAPQTNYQRDWNILNHQPVGEILRLDPAACDPITARIIDQTDVSHYFELFFRYRNPLLGILDPALHTPSYIYSMSFTLFSTICALGCALSDRTRDRVLYPVLLDIAEADVKWSIACSVKSLETIQAIMNKQYWAPIVQHQSDDPSWLRLSHAVQIAREMGICKPAVIAAQVNAMAPSDNPCFKERLARNFERTWLYTFIADKGFGITTGRHMGVSWTEVPALASEWWKKTMTTSTDRLLSGSIEMRGILLNAFCQRKRDHCKTASSIYEWHRTSLSLLKQKRASRCNSDEALSANCLSVLAFYIDHGIMMLNSEALRDLLAVDQTTISHEVLTISKITVDTANQFLKLLLTDAILDELFIGFHNNQYIMICHAAAEILHAIKRGKLQGPDILEAVTNVKIIPERLEKTARLLPDSSAVHVYLSLAKVFASQIDNIGHSTSDTPDEEMMSAGYPLADWWRTLELGPFDPMTQFDMEFHEIGDLHL